jgi:hypothetical protein
MYNTSTYLSVAGVKLSHVMIKEFKTKEARIEGVPRYSGVVLGHDKVNYLVGRLLTIIDAMGLDEKQEKSAKDLIKNEVYIITREGWIAPDLHEVLYDLIIWGKHVESSSIPHDPLSGEYTLTFKQAGE